MSWPHVLLIESPVWLWLCASLAIPVVIHLLRRSNPREITFAAVHWLQQQRHRRWKKLFLRDTLLLLLRLLLLLLLILLLVQPFLLRDAQPSDQVLLVDPQVTPESLAKFLSQHPQIHKSFWLQATPTATASARPQATDLWQTLSQLAGVGEFRYAHILLHNAVNPDGYDTLRVSPHWQWHSVKTDAADTAPTPPRIAQLGEGPTWLAPVIQQLAEGPLPGLALEQYPATALLDAQDIDWVIYDTPGALPEHLHQFVENGGLLITDRRVTGATALKFFEREADSELEASAIGRGSWLRYRGDWHREDFFQRAQLPPSLWRHWSTQDWLWLRDSRGRWSIDTAQGFPGVAVADSEVMQQFASPLRNALLLAFALLLMLERSVALSRSAAVSGGGERE
ncbi:BatA domain-containing protein [Microbulbifer bruguierae]|uniref:BatA domain-containing protein n=1 Tax=Microbulbifer bruguierae TaxID=3029061 RepID=A0ABY8N8J2_9GAMM|nr:BatA domain-containing protein [Microbulbifer bruguierae]WGL15226.1 BatA domain-containing protein [Microbulbifer bruguierae]